MMLIKQARIVNRGTITEGDILIKDGRIIKVGRDISAPEAKVIDAKGQLAIPGIIDDQVHFREPGLTHKGEIYTEAKAAVAGGTTSFMEMPNVKPATLTQELLEAKYQRAAQCSLANYSFYMGASNDNIEEVLKTNPKNVCGVKIFMGSSTGNMLVDNRKTLDNLFSKVPMLIATHCEDEATIRANIAKVKAAYGEDVPMELHPIIRSVEGCYKSSSMAVSLAKKHNTRLHILHISTKDELALFRNDIPLEEKRITAEVCVHHLFFNSEDYATKGVNIKWNPAIKGRVHQEALFPALLSNKLDVIATDHAPHLPSEKANSYFNCPSGGPLVQHALNVMLDFYHKGQISIERIVEKMCHAPAVCYELQDRGYLEEGQWADIALVDEQASWTVKPDNILYKCGWSPFEDYTFKGKVNTTIVSGHLAYHEGKFDETQWGQRLTFDRD
ncbi:dihydroorotase [Lewinella cohaerens]|uniref:dihydroorotase n=1 Tax=Lewinella cohaerens TaxID=70995 RepID=UPI00036748AF|nr:dihydroorotase [Lewinella cohaerens]